MTRSRPREEEEWGRAFRQSGESICQGPVVAKNFQGPRKGQQGGNAES